MLTDHSEDPRILDNYARSALPALYTWNSEAWMAAHLVTAWFTEYFKPLLRPTAQDRGLLTDNAPGHPGALLETSSEIHAVSMPAARGPRGHSSDA